MNSGFADYASQLKYHLLNQSLLLDISSRALEHEAKVDSAALDLSFEDQEPLGFIKSDVEALDLKAFRFLLTFYARSSFPA